MSLKKCILFIVLFSMALILFTGCAVPEEASTPTIEVPAAPTETAIPTATEVPATEVPAPTDTPVPEPTATPVPYPSARGFHDMVYDSGSNKIILLGGSTDAVVMPIEEIWTYETGSNTWTLAGTLRSDHPRGTYIADTDRILIYTSIRLLSPSQAEMAGKLHTFDVNTNTLERIEDDSLPIGYSFSPLAYDSESQRVILFGGWVLDGSIDELRNETFAYDPMTNTWTQMNPQTLPPGRSSHMLVYHPTLDRVVLFGSGYNAAWGNLLENDTWAYDFNSDSWTLLKPAAAPPARLNSAMVYVDSTDQIILFGGAREGSPLNDMWAFDHVANTWIELKPENPPGPRAYHAMVYDSAADKIVLFGGGPNWERIDLTNETWIYDPQTNTWTDMTPGN